MIWARTAPELTSSTAMLVRAAEAQQQRLNISRANPDEVPDSTETSQQPSGELGPTKPGLKRNPRRFYGSVEIDMVRPVKAFDAILNAVVMELQRTQGAKIKLTLEIEAEATDGFSEGDVGIVRDNARQLKFKSESTGFED